MATIESSIIDAAYANIIAASGGQPQTLVLQPIKSGVQICGTSNTGTAIVSLPYVVNGLESPVATDPTTLISVAKNRKEVELTVSGATLKVSSGTYKAEVTTTETEGIALAEISNAVVIPMNSDLQLLFNKQLPKLSLEKSHASLADIMLYARVKAGKVFMATYDSYQVHFMKTKTKLKDDVEMQLAYEKAAKLLKNIHGITELAYSKEILQVKTKNIKAQMSLSTFDETSSVGADVLIAKCKEVSEATRSSLVLNKDDLKAFVENSASLATTGYDIRFEVKGSKTKLTMAAPKGKTTAVVSSEGKSDNFRLDLKFIQAILNKSDDEKITFDVLKDNNAIACGTPANLYVATINADTQE